MKKIYHILFLALVACMSLASCSSSDDVTKTPLDTPSISQSTTKVSSLAFNWQPVSGATQYAYELYEGDNLVVGAMTTETSMIATKLQPNTTYTLKVWAYAAVSGEKSTSPVATLTATTNSPTPLDNPVPQASSANGGVTISWPAIENAAGYIYDYTDANDSIIKGTTEDNSITLTDLAIGTYTINITAISDDDEYTNSETISLTFERTKAEIWRKKGMYKSGGNSQSYTAEIVAYDDGSYTIESPYGEEGYSISFTVPEGGTEILPLGTPDDGYYFAYVSSDKYVWIYPSSGNSKFEGDKNKGEVKFYSYLYDSNSYESLGNGSDVFTWGNDQKEMTIDDLCGTYNAKYNGYDDFSENWDKQEVDGTCEVIISKNDDGTINIYNFYDWQDNFTASVDLSARTITIQPSVWSTWYTFADFSASDKAVVGTIDNDGTITFKNFTAWYGTSHYIYEGMTCEMTKK